jgi:hypothetical protein
MENENEYRILDTLTAILIAVVVAIAALVSWRASVIDDGAGDADYAGLRAAVYSVRTQAINSVDSYESYGNYVNYMRNSRLSELLSDELDSLPEDQQIIYYEQMKIATDLADANRDMFDTKYLNRDGSYSVSRQMGVLWADAAKENDMDYQRQFSEADQGRDRTRKMLIAVMVLTIATVFYALVESFEGRLKILMVALGSIVTVAGIVMAALVELTVW